MREGERYFNRGRESRWMKSLEVASVEKKRKGKEEERKRFKKI